MVYYYIEEVCRRGSPTARRPEIHSIDIEIYLRYTKDTQKTHKRKEAFAPAKATVIYVRIQKRNLRRPRARGIDVGKGDGNPFGDQFDHQRKIRRRHRPER